MADLMTFPNTVEEFMEKYKITDTEQIYTNGADLVPIFRMEQWFEHAADVQPVRHGRWIKDCKVAFFWECSGCGCYVFWEPQSYLLRPEDKMNYCPNCGAKMDLKEDK